MCPQPGLRKRPAAVRIQNGSTAAADTGGRQRPGSSAATWQWDAGWPLLMQLLAVFSVLYLLVCRLQVALPAPGALERNARGYLRQLVALGPRVGGSPQNEVHAVQILLDQLSNISYGLPAHHNIQVDRQVVSGTFDLDLIDGMASQYANVQNVVAKLSPVPESDHSILVNCHFDTVMGSPGASDDAVSCAVMMELLRRIAHGERTLRHNIIFLFNGAEENMMQAAHGFVTQHRWAWSVRVHVNLEACGAGGREVVFQTGPGHPWLVRAFAESAPHPFAHILAQEVFQSGIIPADTDFRIFRDYGKVPGLDMAFYSNGFVYHTRFDNEQQISAGSVQRAGENVQAILYRLATTDDIIDAKRQEVSAVVFFDFLGLFMLYCPDWIYVTVCCITVLAVITTIERSRKRQGLRWSQLGTACGVLILSWLCSASFVAVIAVLLDSSGSAMSWYSQQSWIHGVFTLPALSVLVLVQQSLCRCYFPALLKDRRRLEALLYETSRLLLLPSLMLSVLVRVYSGFLMLVMLLFPTIVRSVIIETLLRVSSGGWHLAGYLLSQLAPVSMCFYYAITSLELFMPLTGRVGSAICPDLAIAMITVLSVVGSSWFVLTSVSLSDRACALARIMLVISLTCVGLVTLTSCGFPYDAARPHPRSHRVMLQHVERRFHDRSGAVVDRDSGLIVNNMDRNSPLTLHGHLSGIENSTVLEKLCDRQLYCGVPYYYPVRKVIYRRNFVAGPVPVVNTPVRYNVRRQQLNSTTFKLYLNITGPDHMTMQLCARPGVRLVSWSLGDAGVPRLPSAPFQGRTVYFLYYAWGLHSAPWTLWFQLQVSDSYHSEDYLLDANINGHYLHSEGVQSEYLLNTVSRLPAWMVPTVYTSTLDAVKL